MAHRRDRGREVLNWGVLVACLAFAWGASAEARSPRDVPLSERLARVDARVAWKVELPLKLTVEIEDYHLLDEYLYAFGTDGVVRAIRADNGKVAWMRRVTAAQSHLWPPAAYRFPGCVAVVFTRADDVLFLDPATGEPAECAIEDAAGEIEIEPMESMELVTGSIAQVAVSEDYLFATSPGQRVQRYALEDNVQDWKVRTPGRLHIGPLYVPEHDLVVAVDETGAVAGLSGLAKKHRFDLELEGKPTGWLAADAEEVYVATSKPKLYAIDPLNGDIEMEHSLAAPPATGPTITDRAVYVSLRDRGVERVAKVEAASGWLAGYAHRFLAEWSDRAAMLTADRQLVLGRLDTGEPIGLVALGRPYRAIPNGRNDAAIMATERGEILCIRPIRGEPLLAADFRPAPLPEQPDVVTVEADEEDEPGLEEEEEADAFADEPEELAEADETGDETAAAERGLTLEERLIANPLRTRRTPQ